MHKSTEIKDLFIKFMERKCSPEEVQRILSYVKNSKNLKEVPTVAEVYDMLDEYPDMKAAQADIIFKNILEIATPSKEKSPFWKYAAASIILLALASSYFLTNNVVNSQSEIPPIIVINSIQTGSDKAILTLENGIEVPLEKEQSYVAAHASSNGEELIYDTQKNTTSEIAYNYLTIPRGGQFQLKLADGTKVWLNSETKLKYPIAFIEGQTRQVELLYGEAYFEVSPSSNHNGSKFNVKTKLQDVEVLGTEFNIKAYQNDTNIYTTLVEGKVAINRMDKVQHLSPNQQSILNRDDNELAIINIDVYNEISWKDGLFSFKGKPLKEIVTVLSRWYDIEFEFDNENLENVKFNGVLLKKQSIEEILIIIKETKFINAYEITDKIIIIK
ncbi:FecR family protein [Gelidibacter salicanalis]|uniref:FecR family protein n=1 Tax=Gelidibacter salicanalis TaxID=291193 RepID=A0A934KPS2_9FLAO|nr:FecR family protein [Gelidibacter salicanalis]MBJ7879221.1 FecR family protein [Gelidibacter salicanalis]